MTSIPPRHSEPTCGNQTADGPCWHIAGHPGPCQG